MPACPIGGGFSSSNVAFSSSTPCRTARPRRHSSKHVVPVENAKGSAPRQPFLRRFFGCGAFAGAALLRTTLLPGQALAR